MEFTKMKYLLTQARKVIMSIAVVLVSLSSFTAHAADYDAAKQQWHNWHNSRFVVEVVENPLRFSFDQLSPVLNDGSPAYGNPFVTEGYIYPAGTLKDGDSGVDDQGKPLYPDKVLGQWTCRGVFVGEGMATITGPVVNTTQLFSFYKTQGYDPAKLSNATSVVTEGFEMVEVGVPVTRAITGGTGRFNRTRGEVKQTLLGYSEAFGVSLRIKFRAYR
jgi:hypothetical protein